MNTIVITKKHFKNRSNINYVRIITDTNNYKNNIKVKSFGGPYSDRGSIVDLWYRKTMRYT